MAMIPSKNDHAASLFISKRFAYDGVKKAHMCSPWIDSSGPCWLHTITSKNMPATDRRYRCDGQVTAELRCRLGRPSLFRCGWGGGDWADCCENRSEKDRGDGRSMRHSGATGKRRAGEQQRPEHALRATGRSGAGIGGA